MAPKKFTEDLLEALSDPRIVSALTSTWSLLLDKVILPMKEKMVKLEDCVERQAKDIVALKEENVTLHSNIDELERHARLDNLIFKGIPETSYAEISTDSPEAHGDDLISDESSANHKPGFLVCKMAAGRFIKEKLGVELHPDDISFAYRMKKNSQEQHRPLFVHFSNSHARESVYNARVRLKNSGIFINEHLTSMTSSLFAETRTLTKSKKLYKTWTMHGVIHVVKSSGSKPIKIRHKTDLMNITK